MKKLDEVQKQTGWSAATPAANAADAPAAEEPSEDACPDCGGAGFVRRTVRLRPPGLGQGVPPRRPGDGGGGQRGGPPPGPPPPRFPGGPSGWLVFGGPSGCGKTPLAAAIASRCIEGGRPALFMVEAL